MWVLFGHKKRIKELKIEIQDSFDHVKKDFNKVGEWIKHLDDKHSSNQTDIDNIKDQLFSIHEDLIEIKDFISFFGPQLSKQSAKQMQTINNKQTLPNVVQTHYQTDVQTDILSNLTVMERAIVWTLLNSDMRLSYEDIASLLGKEKSTIRGQINTIKQKNSSLIMEKREINGKKRLYISDEIKDIVMKNMKLKVKNEKIKKKSKK